jgi:hypothetical protein
MKGYQAVRYGLGRNTTLSFFNRIKDDVAEKMCFALEDERRHTKVPGETCIPTGTYELKLRTEGGMHQRYLERYGDRHKGMLWLQNVENFQFVYIHIGNTDDDTQGCILPGKVPLIYPDGEFHVGRSGDAYWEIYEEIAPALIAGEKVVIHVTEIQPWA